MFDTFSEMLSSSSHVFTSMIEELFAFALFVVRCVAFCCIYARQHSIRTMGKMFEWDSDEKNEATVTLMFKCS